MKKKEKKKRCKAYKNLSEDMKKILKVFYAKKTPKLFQSNVKNTWNIMQEMVHKAKVKKEMYFLNVF